MDENKEKNPISAGDGTDDENLNKAAPASDETPDSIQDEMEDLKKTFQEELDKAKAQAKAVAENPPEEPEILIQDLEDLPKNDEVKPADEVIPEGELCECCGEKRRGNKNNPDSPYCTDCERALRHYPFDLLNVLIALIAVGLSFYACYVFADYSSIYVAAEKADAYVESGKLYSAYTAYNDAATAMTDGAVNGEMIYKRSIDNLTQLGGLDYITDITTNFKSWEIKLPHMRSVYNAIEFSQELSATRDAGYEIFGELIASDAAAADIPYDEVISRLDALVGTTVVATADDSSTSTTAAFGITAQKYCPEMISFLKFYAAYMCEKDYQTQIGFLEEIKAENPKITWFYGSWLGDLYAKTGVDVTEFCNYMRSINSEDTSADVIEASALRIKGDYSGCIAICQPKIDENDDYTYEFYRQMALCYLATGNYTAAYDKANSAYETYNTLQVCDTLALCCVATGNTDKYNEIDTLLTDNGYSLSDEVVGYKDGTLTLADIIMKGDFDVQ